MAFLAIAAIAFLAFLVQGTTGFGAALVLAPLLLLFLDLKTAVVAAALVQVPIGAWLASRRVELISRPALRQVLPTSIIGLIVGTTMLAVLAVGWLKTLCGVLTCVFAIDLLRRSLSGRATQPWPARVAPFAAFASGVLGGLFGTSGPPIIAYLERQLPQPGSLRATLIAYFLVLNILRLLGYSTAALVSPGVLLAAAAMLPAAILGARLGEQIQRRINDQAFRRLVAAVLLLTGLMLAISA